MMTVFLQFPFILRSVLALLLVIIPLNCFPLLDILEALMARVLGGLRLKLLQGRLP